MTTSLEPVCKRCHGPVGPDDVLVRNAGSDPLRVSERARCEAIVDVGGHSW